MKARGWKEHLRKDEAEWSLQGLGGGWAGKQGEVGGQMHRRYGDEDTGNSGHVILGFWTPLW